MVDAIERPALTAHIEAPLPKWAMITFPSAIRGATILSVRVMYS